LLFGLAFAREDAAQVAQVGNHRRRRRVADARDARDDPRVVSKLRVAIDVIVDPVRAA